MITPDQIKHLKARFKWGLNYRDTTWREEWMDIKKYIAPKLGRFMEKGRNPGEYKPERKAIINGSAQRARSIAVSGIKGGLTPQSLPWFKLGLYDRDLEKWEPAREWLHTVTTRMQGVFSGSNFYSSIMNVYDEEITFALGGLYIVDHPDKVAHFKPWTAGTYVLMQNEYGEIDTAFREYWWTLRNVVARFGEEKLSITRRAQYKNNPDNYIKVIHAVLPRTDIKPGAIGAKNMAWASIYWEDGCDADKILGESGFRTKPCMFPRWDSVEEGPYGSDCPGMQLLPDIKMLQKLELEKLLGIEKVNSPPMNVPAAYKGRVNLNPRAQNYVGTNEKIEPTLNLAPGVRDVREEIRDVERRINEGFFNDLFLMFIGEDKNMTATEVIRRNEEKLALLGPVVERQNSELLSPIIERTFDLMLEAGRIPPPPQELQQQVIRVEYISLLAQAQRAVGTGAIERTMDVIGRIAEVQANTGGEPLILDKVQWDDILDEYSDLVGMSPKLLRSNQEAMLIRRNRDQQRRQQQELDQLQQGAQVAKDLAQAPTDQNNALSAVMRRAQ